MLGYPFCFRSCGLVLGTLLMAVSIFASRFSYNLLLYCSQISNKRTYEDLADQAIGEAGPSCFVTEPLFCEGEAHGNGSKGR